MTDNVCTWHMLLWMMRSVGVVRFLFPGNVVLICKVGQTDSKVSNDFSYHKVLKPTDG